MEVLKNTKYQIWTDSGWSDFDGLMIKGTRDTVSVTLANGSTIESTPDHKFYTEAMIPVEAQNLVGRRVVVGDGIEEVASVNPAAPQKVYDIHNVKNNRRFYANGMLVSNCEFINANETLIHPLKLAALKGVDPLFSSGQVRWYHRPTKNQIYVVTLDPSTGTGGDNAAIQVVELPAMRQVAEWQHNKTPVEGQIRTLLQILHFLRDNGAEEIYWTLENNAVGEAALVVVRDTGEENFPGDFMSEPRRAAGRRGRRGFNTTNRNKLEACVKFKNYIENNKLEISSKPLIKEIKNFVAHGASYSGKGNDKDDLVMSMLLAVRLIGLVASFEDRVYDTVNSSISGNTNFFDDEDDEPYPMFI